MKKPIIIDEKFRRLVIWHNILIFQAIFLAYAEHCTQQEIERALHMQCLEHLNPYEMEDLIQQHRNLPAPFLAGNPRLYFYYNNNVLNVMPVPRDTNGALLVVKQKFI